MAWRAGNSRSRLIQTMPESEITTTRFLVLRKTPYSETSLVLAGISPDSGQLHFLVRGARRLTRKQFPVADLFRELQVQYRPGRSGLHNPRTAEVIRDFGTVARQLSTFNTAVWLARFALANVVGEAEGPRFYEALITALERLKEQSGQQTTEHVAECAAFVGVPLVYLDEHGLLSDYAHAPAKRRRRQLLLRMAVGEEDPPNLSPADWKRIREWVESLLHYTDCHVPGMPPPEARRKKNGTTKQKKHK